MQGKQIYNLAAAEVFTKSEESAGFVYDYKERGELTVHKMIKNGIELGRIEVWEIDGIPYHNIYRTAARSDQNGQACEEWSKIEKQFFQKRDIYRWASAEKDRIGKTSATQAKGIPPHPLKERRQKVLEMVKSGQYFEKEIAEAIQESVNVVKQDKLWLRNRGFLPKSR